MTEPMTPDQFYDRMLEFKDFDQEGGHIEMDDLMAETLKELGYGDGMDVYDKFGKWYA